MQLTELIFSPTGGTRKAADVLAAALTDEAPQLVDLTDPAQDFSTVRLDADAVALIAAPSYGGRVPAVAAERLRAVQGNGARAVLVAVYGNRAYEDTLVELEDLAVQAGFRVVAAVAAIAEHSIARQIAAGRPDAEDQAALADFGRRIAAKLAEGSADAPAIPGNRPYKKGGSGGMTPHTTHACVRCGRCAALCPVQAIDREDPSKVDGKRCISCMRCIQVCPHDAKKLNGAMLAAVGAMLGKVAGERKENELFI